MTLGLASAARSAPPMRVFDWVIAVVFHVLSTEQIHEGLAGPTPSP